MCLGESRIRRFWILFITIVMIGVAVLVPMVPRILIERGTHVPDEYYEFIMQYAPHLYIIRGVGPDPRWGRAVSAAAFAIDFLYDAYHNPRSPRSRRPAIYEKVVSLAEFILTQQSVSDAGKGYYGGFRSNETNQYYYSVDAARAIPSLIRAHRLTGRSTYLDAAKLAGNRFLHVMQSSPALARRYRGFMRGVLAATDGSEIWLVDMDVENLYALIGLKMLVDYDPENKATYKNMMADLLSFLRYGLENLYLHYSPLPVGDGKWHRVGQRENEIYDDSLAYALLGAYDYEGWSKTVQLVYSSINTASGQKNETRYDPSICWAGYIDVVNRRPACDYYDSVTAGILSEIRRKHDRSSLEISVQTIMKHRESFMFWGVRFSDYSCVENSQAVISVAWLSIMLLDYEEQNVFPWR